MLYLWIATSHCTTTSYWLNVMWVLFLLAMLLKFYGIDFIFGVELRLQQTKHFSHSLRCSLSQRCASSSGMEYWAERPPSWSWN